MATRLVKNATRQNAAAPMRSILLQIALVIGVGLVFALASNHFSPLGLSLSRDYFPSATTPEAIATPESLTSLSSQAPMHEFGVATRSDVQSFIADPRFVMQKFLLIDARSIANFHTGHIPGALQYDHYRPTDNIALLIPPCQAAEKIILYCHGGSCQDSIFAARQLVSLGIPASRLSIYEQGISDWQSAGLPTQN